MKFPRPSAGISSILGTLLSYISPKSNLDTCIIIIIIIIIIIPFIVVSAALFLLLLLLLLLPYY